MIQLTVFFIIGYLLRSLHEIFNKNVFIQSSNDWETLRGHDGKTYVLEIVNLRDIIEIFGELCLFSLKHWIIRKFCLADETNYTVNTNRGYLSNI